MSRLPKYLNEFRENYIVYLLGKTKLRKKDIERLCEGSNYDNLVRKISFQLSLKGIPMSPEAGIPLFFYDKFTHYCLTNMPEQSCDKLQITESIHECFIDFRYKSDNYFIQVVKRGYPIYLNNHECMYSVSLFADRDAVHREVANRLTTRDIDAWPNIKRNFSFPLIKVHLDRNGYAVLFEPEEVTQLRGFGGVAIAELSGGTPYYRIEENDWKLDAEAFDFPTIPEILGVVQHVLTCANNPRSIRRSNGKVREKYNKSKIHVVSKEDKGDCVYVPLDSYIKDYNPSTRQPWKGGHHASPVEHDRASYYRRSRGKGDYDLVGDKFVFVGGGKGKYSKVAATM